PPAALPPCRLPRGMDRPRQRPERHGARQRQSRQRLHRELSSWGINGYQSEPLTTDERQSSLPLWGVGGSVWVCGCWVCGCPEDPIPIPIPNLISTPSVPGTGGGRSFGSGGFGL